MKQTKSNKASSQEPQNGHSPSSKLLNPEASWDKGLGLSCGLLCGAVPLIGPFWIVAFLVLSTSTIYSYYAYVLKVDEEDFGGHGALLQEGLFASLSLFLLSWIVIYTLLHF